jgi:hypothetical protein
MIGLELETHHPVIEPVSAHRRERKFPMQRRGRKSRLIAGRDQSRDAKGNRSPPNISLFSGNLTGKFAIFRPWRQFSIREVAVPQWFVTKFPKTINRVKFSDNRDRNRVSSEIQSGYQKRPFLTHLSPLAAARNLFSPAKLR